jgi:dolichol-phosphate mannosyltransferase
LPPKFSISDESFSGVSVITTTWNEAENIAKLITAVREVLKDYPHEIIVVDDSSKDGTLNAAKPLADIAVEKKREGQTQGLLFGMKIAKYPIIVTIDSDLENDPKFIPQMLEQIRKYDLVIACRDVIPRFSEKIASKTLGKLVGAKDAFSNYRAYRKTNIGLFELSLGETFGAEILIIAKKNKLRIGQIAYLAPPRRKNPRIGGSVKANFRILWALTKTLVSYTF